VHSFEIRKARNVTPLLILEKSQLIGSAMFPESPRKDWRGNSCWLHPQETSREIQGPGGVTTVEQKLHDRVKSITHFTKL